MSDKPEDKKRFGLKPAEFANLVDMLRYGVIIVTTVALTFVVVALISKFWGY